MISGNGTNLQALIDRISEGRLPGTIVRVISNRKDAFGLERARRAEIPTAYHNLMTYKKKYPPSDEGIKAAREMYDADLADLVLKDSPKLVICLGFMHILSPAFLKPIKEAHIEVINLHPALPGAFDGTVSLLNSSSCFAQDLYGSLSVYLLGFSECDRTCTCCLERRQD